MYSTETALIKLVDELLFGLDNNHVCGMVLVDYRKAFDMVDHVEASNVINDPKCNKGPKCNNFWP